VICATNKNLDEEIKTGNFREDLYYRINLLDFYLPSLRERRDDIPLLTGYFLYKFRQKYASKAIQRFSSDCLSLLTKYDWPGNVRELMHTVERAVIYAQHAVIKCDLLPKEIVGESKPKSLKEIEKEHIIRVLDYTDGNKEKAARILGIVKETLYNKGREYKLSGFSKTV
jgi:transcriptional regulator with PAS, ATPase and Fis domain